MSNVREYHRRIESAIEDRDVGRAIDLRAELQETEPPIDELLAEFQAAIADGEYEEAETVRHALRERFAARRPTEKAAIQRATAARDAGELAGDDVRTVREHVAAGMELSSARASFLITSALFLSRPADAADGDVIEKTTDLEERERDYENTARAAAPVVDAAAVPASIEVLESGIDQSSIAVDSPTTVRVRVANVGDEPAAGITVAADPSDALSVTPGERAIDEIDPDGTATLSFRVTGHETGEHRLGVTAEAETGGTSHTRLSLEVAADAASSPLLEAFSDADGTVRFEDVVDAIAHFNEGDAAPGMDEPVAFQDVLWVIERYNGDA